MFVDRGEIAISEGDALNPAPVQAGGQHSFACAQDEAAPLQRIRRAGPGRQNNLHAFVVGTTAAFGDDPIDNLVGIGDVAGFAVDTVGGVDF